MHASDLDVLLSEVPANAETYCVPPIVDGGPDFNPQHMMNFIVYGRLWKDHGLDGLIITCHSPGNLAYNKIDHACMVTMRYPNLWLALLCQTMWPVSYLLVSTQIYPKKTRDARSVVFDQAVDILCGYWNGLTFDGHPVSSRKVQCVEAEQAYSDHITLEQFVKVSMTTISEDQQLQDIQSVLIFL